jgi:hypothetical protein
LGRPGVQAFFNLLIQASSPGAEILFFNPALAGVFFSGFVAAGEANAIYDPDILPGCD